MADRQSLTLSINPTYLCNFRCRFCYLTPEQLASREKLDLKKLEDMLEKITKEGLRVDHIDLYGGEIALLSEDYLNELHELVGKYNNGELNIVTNLSKIHPYFLRDDVNLSVSYDFSARERHEEVFNNLIMVPKPVSILMLASPELIRIDVETIIKHLNLLNNVRSVEVKPYSANQSNQLETTDREFEEFIKKWLSSDLEMNFQFMNKDNIEAALDGSRNAYSDDHLYITPQGKFAVLDFDSDDNEEFVELSNGLEGYMTWRDLEREKVQNNRFCSQCRYLGHCLTEHYRDVKSLDESCSGFKGLLDWSSRNLYS